MKKVLSNVTAITAALAIICLFGSIFIKSENMGLISGAILIFVLSVNVFVIHGVLTNKKA